MERNAQKPSTDSKKSNLKPSMGTSISSIGENKVESTIPANKQQLSSSDDQKPNLNQVLISRPNEDVPNKLESTLPHDSEDFTKSKSGSEVLQILNVWKTERVSELKIKRAISYIVLTILGLQVLLINVLIGCIGYGILKYDEWTLRLFLTSVFAEIVLVARIVIESLFPKNSSKDMLDFIFNVFDTQNSSTKTSKASEASKETIETPKKS